MALGSWGATNTFDNLLISNLPTATYSYDANGNMTGGAGRSIVWDAENRPTSVTNGASTSYYVYDGDGKLAEKTSTTQTFFEDFDTKDTGPWTYSSYQTVDTGTIKSAGQGSWAANFYRSTYNLSPGKIVQVDFKVDAANPNSVICVEASSGGTYYRWGITINDGNIYAQYNDGTGYHTAKNLIPGFELNTWYVLVLKPDDDGDASGELFRTEVYQKDNPAIRGYYTLDMPDGLSWRFHHWIWSGNSYLDNYYERSIGSDVVYDGNLYERDLLPSPDVETKYYYYEGQRVAVRKGSTVYYLLSDHLGGPVSSYRASDGAMQEMRYLSYGGSRFGPAGLPTARLYTGQLLDDSTGLYQMGARWYDPSIGRFVSPDSTIPDPSNPQSLNRYSYGYNNPVRCMDPTGHYAMCLPVCALGGLAIPGVVEALVAALTVAVGTGAIINNERTRQEVLSSHESSDTTPLSQASTSGEPANPKPPLRGQDLEDWARSQLSAEQYTEDPFGTTDVEIGRNLGIKGQRADIVKLDSEMNRWVIAESKGNDLLKAYNQLENTYNAFMGQVTGNTSVSLRVYVSRDVYQRLLIGDRTGNWVVQDGILGSLGDGGVFVPETIDDLPIFVVAGP